MNYIGIDQSLTSTGFVVISEDGTLIDHCVIRSDANDSVYKRTEFVAETLLSFCRKYSPAKIAIEGLAFGGTGDATRNLAGLQIHIIIQLSIKNAFEIEIVPPQSLKKFGTGSGRADKKEMLLHVPQHHKEILEKTHKRTKGLFDVVDAYWLAKFCKDKNQQKIS